MKTFIIISAALIAVTSAALNRPYSPNQKQSVFGRQQQPQVYQPVPAPSGRYTGGGSGAEIPILRLDSNIEPDGSYSYAYETGNGISASENGVGGVSAQGQAQWTDPEGTLVQLSYVADENGYQPTGSHIPTPPPVPEAILRALEYIRTHPSQESQQGGQYQPSPQPGSFGRQQLKPASPYRG